MLQVTPKLSSHSCIEPNIYAVNLFIKT